MKPLAALLGLVLLGACSSAPTRPLATVAQVDLQRYLGSWYEIALLPNRFQAMCVSDTQAHYSLEGETLRVRNRCRRADGGIEEAQGVAHVVSDSGNAKLRVSFFRPFYGNYWILALAPDYRWALVGEPGRQYAWVLSRSTTLAAADLDAALQRATALGFDAKAFRTTPQQQPIAP